MFKKKLFVTLLAIGLTSFFEAEAQQPLKHYKLYFGNGKLPTGYEKVGIDKKYNNDYGFDLESSVVTNPGEKGVNIGVTSDKPILFSLNVPEGNYKVTVAVGGGKQGSMNTIKAESRRLMIQELTTAPGEVKHATFIVNVRKPAIKNKRTVKLKAREIGKLDWDDKLTLNFSGKDINIQSLEVEKAEDQITVYLAGNSTVVDGDQDPFCAWGQMIPRFFKPGVAIANHAESGLTLASFLGGNRLEKILSVIKPGDYLFIEFGHNDQKEKGELAGAFVGYTNRLNLYIDSVRAHGAIPVIVTSTARRRFDKDGKSINTLGDYPDAARKVAKDKDVAMIDLNQLTTKLYDAWGVEASTKAFAHYPANTFAGQEKKLEDNTHFNAFGAYEVAKCIALGIQQSNLNLRKFLVDFKFDPGTPDNPEILWWPMNFNASAVKPDGN